MAISSCCNTASTFCAMLVLSDVILSSVDVTQLNRSFIYNTVLHMEDI